MLNKLNRSTLKSIEVCDLSEMELQIWPADSTASSAEELYL